jgi:hypothetical protein
MTTEVDDALAAFMSALLTGKPTRKTSRGLTEKELADVSRGKGNPTPVGNLTPVTV